MVVFVFIFFIVGLVAIVMETVTPHGVSGFIGVALMIFAGWMTFEMYGVKLGVAYCVMALSIGGIVARFALVNGVQWMDLKPAARKGPSSTAKPAGPELLPAPGDAARVAQPLRPTGTIEWNGKRYPARTLHTERESPVGAEVVIRGKESVYYLCEESAARRPGTEA